MFYGHYVLCSFFKQSKAVHIPFSLYDILLCICRYQVKRKWYSYPYNSAFNPPPLIYPVSLSIVKSLKLVCGGFTFFPGTPGISGVLTLKFSLLLFDY